MDTPTPLELASTDDLIEQLLSRFGSAIIILSNRMDTGEIYTNKRHKGEHIFGMGLCLNMAHYLSVENQKTQREIDPHEKM